MSTPWHPGICFLVRCLEFFSLVSDWTRTLWNRIPSTSPSYKSYDFVEQNCDSWSGIKPLYLCSVCIYTIKNNLYTGDSLLKTHINLSTMHVQRSITSLDNKFQPISPGISIPGQNKLKFSTGECKVEQYWLRLRMWAAILKKEREKERDTVPQRLKF